MMSLLLLLIKLRKNLQKTFHQRLRAGAKEDEVQIRRTALHCHGLVLLLLLQQVFHFFRQGTTTSSLPPSRPDGGGGRLDNLILRPAADAHSIPAAGAGEVAVAVGGREEGRVGGREDWREGGRVSEGFE
jgi:hypothetical protein